MVEYILEDDAHTDVEPDMEGAGLALIFTSVVTLELLQEPIWVYTV